jgi:glucose-6-phosphate 1-dehydrogenase
MSFDLILFGGTGDLAWRKIMPALFQAFRHGSLPADGRIIGVARDDLSDDQYRALIKSRFDNVELSKRPNEEEFTRFAQMLGYLRMDLSKPDDYARLADLLRQRPADVVVMNRSPLPASTARKPAWCLKSRWAMTWRRTAPSIKPFAAC